MSDLTIYEVWFADLIIENVAKLGNYDNSKDIEARLSLLFAIMDMKNKGPILARVRHQLSELRDERKSTHGPHDHVVANINAVLAVPMMQPGARNKVT